MYQNYDSIFVTWDRIGAPCFSALPHAPYLNRHKPDTRTMIVLSNSSPIARGGNRSVYVFPGRKDRLIKVLHSLERKRSRKGLKGMIRRRFPMTLYRFLFREYDSYLRTMVELKNPELDPPLAHQWGLVETDLGLGMVCERIQMDGNHTAPTLRALATNGTLGTHMDLLNQFIQDMFKYHVRVNDLNADNVVLGARDGKPQFVLIDGLGDSWVIPLRRWSTRINDRSLHKRIRRLTDNLGLSWHPDTRTIS